MIGVLGGIASGKSAVAALLAGRDGRVIDADRLVGELYADPAFVAEIAKRFGAGVVARGGAIDRQALAKVVFDDPRAREELENRIHPVVRERIRGELDAAVAAREPWVALDVPLLLENDARHGLARRCDALVFVESDADDRERRARAARGWREGEVARREAAQLALDEKRRRADVIVENRGDRAELERQVARARAELEKLLANR